MKHNEDDKLRDDLQTQLAAEFWDSQYAEGRFLDMPADPFLDAILSAAADHGLLPGPGLYIGVGNGRNYFPLVQGGLELVGLDVSGVGLDSIRERAPEHADRLVHGDLSALPDGRRFPVVVGLNVFHHGDRDAAGAHIRGALERVAPGGLFCISVAAVGSKTSRPTEVAADHDDGSRTLRYLQEDGKPSLLTQFFSESALADLLAAYEAVVPLFLDDTDTATGRPGDWLRWQGVYRRPV